MRPPNVKNGAPEDLHLEGGGPKVRNRYVTAYSPPFPPRDAVHMRGQRLYGQPVWVTGWQDSAELVPAEDTGVPAKVPPDVDHETEPTESNQLTAIEWLELGLYMKDKDD